MDFDNRKILYADSRIEISQTEYPDEHHLTIGGENGAYCLLQRGVLNDLAHRRDIDDFRTSMNAMNEVFVSQLEEKKISLEVLAWAFSKARMKELEDEANYFASSKRKVRNLRQAH